MAATISLLICDLDDFKVINDTFGHLAGDDVHIGIARRLCNSIRDDATAARLGSDELAVLLNNGEQATVDLIGADAALCRAKHAGRNCSVKAQA